MRIATNKIHSIVKFYRSELDALYNSGEIENFIFYSFNEILGFSRSDIMTRPESTVSESELLKFNSVVKQLKKHRPIQYILGSAHFYGMNFIVDESVLIPRPETEELVSLIIKENKEKENLNVLDICTGSGCIAIALDANLKNASVTGIDISEESLLIAGKNAAKHNGIVNFKKADVLNSDLNEIKTQFDIIVSNPPYILLSEKGAMDKNVLDYEPHLALFVENDDPLIFYIKIVEFALKSLNPGGKLYFEINEKMGDETKSLLKKMGFENCKILKDINGKNRILSCSK